MSTKIIFVSIIVIIIAGAAGFVMYKNNPKPTVTPVNVQLQIESLLATKYNKSVSDVKVTIAKQDDNYVAGSVTFDKGGPGEVGLVLAAKIKDVWTLVYDGNGSIDCNKMRQVYKFPDSILKPNYCQ